MFYRGVTRGAERAGLTAPPPKHRKGPGYLWVLHAAQERELGVALERVRLPEQVPVEAARAALLLLRPVGDRDGDDVGKGLVQAAALELVAVVCRENKWEARVV